MDHGKKKMGMGGRMQAMYGGMKKREKKMEGGKAHSGAQPTYGSTVADAMPKGMAN